VEAVTPPESPSSLLERAAQRLERLADLATQGTWRAAPHPHSPGKANVVIEVAQLTGGFTASLFNSSCCGGNCYGHVENGDDAVWIATVSPAIAAPVVAWLRDSASSVREHDEDIVANGERGRYCPNEDQAVELARLILGEPVPGEDG
jgi:hypothetical protein